MRPPILWLALGFAAGLALGLAQPSIPWTIALPLSLAAAVLAARAPLGAALGIAAVAGLAWGAAARREREATCPGQWESGTREAGSVAATVRLLDPVGDAGGVVEGRVIHGRCGGVLRLRWLEGVSARGGTAWIVAGRWLGSAGRGVLVVRRARALPGAPAGRGAWRDRIARRSAELFGSRAPLVDALVIGRRAELDRAVRERYVRSGLAHLLSISGLHVGFLAAWLGVLLARLPLGRATRFAASTALVGAYVGLL
ncbi:MAG: ComEC/Rec2 family competence protein, partial [Gemmatimonadales bacterium]